MRVTVTVGVDARAYFRQLEEALLADIAAARGKKAKASNLHAGYSYKKYLRGKKDPAHAATVRFVAFERPHTVATTVTTGAGVTTMAYTLEPAEGGCTVTYTETYEGSGATALVQRARGALMSASAKHRVREQLRALEARALAAAYPAEGEGAPGAGA